MLINPIEISRLPFRRYENEIAPAALRYEINMYGPRDGNEQETRVMVASNSF